MTDASGVKVEITEYVPYGEMRAHTGAEVSNYKFTDQELDPESGLYNYDARLYDPVIGRFMTSDSMVPDVYDPQALNHYSYCRNNPLIYVDPSGHAYYDGGGGGSWWGSWGWSSWSRASNNDYWGRLYTLPINTTYGEHSRGVYRNNLGNMEVGVGIRQSDPSLNTQFNKVMKKEGCHFLALEYTAEMWAEKNLTPGQINKSREDAAKAGIIKGYYDLYVERPQDLIQDTLDRLGSNARAEISSYQTRKPREGEADYTIVRGVNPITGHRHSQAGDSWGNTIWDPGYRTPVILGDPMYLYIKFY